MDVLGIKIDVMFIVKVLNVEQGIVIFGQCILDVFVLIVFEWYIYVYSFLFFYLYFDMFNI